jgi:hypothetical protein
VYLPLVVLGACVEALAAILYVDRRLFIARAVRVEGKVVGHRTQMSEGEEGYAPIVSYVVDGTTHQVESGMFSNVAREIGSPMVVLHTPAKAILEQSGTRILMLGLALAGVGLTLGGALGK